MPHEHPRGLRVLDAGLMPYGEALALQTATHAAVARGDEPPTLILVEHPAVLTLGKHANPSFVVASRENLAERGVALVETDRGGEVTAHNPGQLVAYPIMPVGRLGLGARAYVDGLEAAVIATLAQWGLTGAPDPVNPGVWLGRDKVCAVGIRIKNRVAMHGIALNVVNDLSIFGLIVPCGIQGRGVTSVARALGRAVPMADVKAAFVAHFGRTFAARLDAAGDPASPSPDLANP